MSAEFRCQCRCHNGGPGHVAVELSWDARGRPVRTTVARPCACAAIGPCSCLACRQGLHRHRVYAGGDIVCDQVREQRRQELIRRAPDLEQRVAAYTAEIRPAIDAAIERRVAAGGRR